MVNKITVKDKARDNSKRKKTEQNTKADKKWHPKSELESRVVSRNWLATWNLNLARQGGTQRPHLIQLDFHCEDIRRWEYWG